MLIFDLIYEETGVLTLRNDSFNFLNQLKKVIFVVILLLPFYFLI